MLPPGTREGARTMEDHIPPDEGGTPASPSPSRAVVSPASPPAEQPLSPGPAGLPEAAPHFSRWALLGLLGTFFCCGGFFLTLPGALLASGAKSNWDRGRYEEARRKLRTAKILTLAGLRLGLLGWIALAVVDTSFTGFSSPPSY